MDSVSCQTPLTCAPWPTSAVNYSFNMVCELWKYGQKHFLNYSVSVSLVCDAISIYFYHLDTAYTLWYDTVVIPFRGFLECTFESLISKYNLPWNKFSQFFRALPVYSLTFPPEGSANILEKPENLTEEWPVSYTTAFTDLSPLENQTWVRGWTGSPVLGPWVEKCQITRSSFLTI